MVDGAVDHVVDEARALRPKGGFQGFSGSCRELLGVAGSCCRVLQACSPVWARPRTGQLTVWPGGLVAACLPARELGLEARSEVVDGGAARTEARHGAA